MSNEGEGARRLGLRFWLILALVLIIVVGGATAGTLYFLGVNLPGSEKERVLPTYQIEMAPFTVNLKDNNYKRYLRLEITLESHDKRLLREIEEKNHRSRDVIIGVLADKTVADLEDREALKNELINALNAVLMEGQISGIFFDQFMLH